MVDINAYSGYLIPAIAIISFILSAYNFLDKIKKEKFPSISIKVNDTQENPFDRNLGISATNNGLRTVVISSCNIEVVEPKDTYFEDYRQFNKILNAGMPQELIPNRSFCRSFSLIQLVTYIGNKNGLKFKIVFVIDDHKYNSRVFEITGSDYEEFKDISKI